jgi:hypothetical protein
MSLQKENAQSQYSIDGEPKRRIGVMSNEHRKAVKVIVVKRYSFLLYSRIALFARSCRIIYKADNYWNV